MNLMLPGGLDLHDGKLLGMFLAEDSAMIFAKTEAGQILTMHLDGIYRFHASDVYEGNVIFDCQVIGDPSHAADALTTLLRGEALEKGLPRLRALMESGIYQLFVINPSYGASVIALVASIRTEVGIGTMNGVIL